MVRKITGIAIAMLLLFSVLGLVACNGSSLAEYKFEAKAEITAYVDSLTQGEYFAEDWLLIGQKATEGKAAVDVAADNAQVDAVKMAAITSIDEVRSIMEQLAFKIGFFPTGNGLLSENFLNANRVYGVHYEDYDSGEPPSYPHSRVIFVREQNEFEQTYSYINSDLAVDFDTEILILYTFAYPRPYKFLLDSISLDSEKLCVYLKSVGVDGLSGYNNMTAPKQVWIALRTDKIDIATADFIVK